MQRALAPLDFDLIGRDGVTVPARSLLGRPLLFVLLRYLG